MEIRPSIPDQTAEPNVHQPDDQNLAEIVSREYNTEYKPPIQKNWKEAIWNMDFTSGGIGPGPFIIEENAPIYSFNMAMIRGVEYIVSKGSAAVSRVNRFRQSRKSQEPQL